MIIDFKSKKQQSDESTVQKIIEMAMEDDNVLVDWLSKILADCKRNKQEDKAKRLIAEMLEKKSKLLYSRIVEKAKIE